MRWPMASSPLGFAAMQQAQRAPTHTGLAIRLLRFCFLAMATVGLLMLHRTRIRMRHVQPGNASTDVPGETVAYRGLRVTHLRLFLSRHRSHIVST